MNKAQLIDKLAEKNGLNKNQVESLIDALLEEIINSLKQGEEVTLTGFGAFIAKSRHARMGVNPRNPGERIEIPAVTVAKFKTGKVLKEALKNTVHAKTTEKIETPLTEE